MTFAARASAQRSDDARAGVRAAALARLARMHAQAGLWRDDARRDDDAGGSGVRAAFCSAGDASAHACTLLLPAGVSGVRVCVPGVAISVHDDELVRACADALHAWMREFDRPRGEDSIARALQALMPVSAQEPIAYEQRVEAARALAQRALAASVHAPYLRVALGERDDGDGEDGADRVHYRLGALAHVLDVLLALVHIAHPLGAALLLQYSDELRSWWQARVRALRTHCTAALVWRDASEWPEAARTVLPQAHRALVAAVLDDAHVLEGELLARVSRDVAAFVDAATSTRRAVHAPSTMDEWRAYARVVARALAWASRSADQVAAALLVRLRGGSSRSLMIAARAAPLLHGGVPAMLASAAALTAVPAPAAYVLGLLTSVEHALAVQRALAAPCDALHALDLGPGSGSLWSLDADADERPLVALLCTDPKRRALLGTLERVERRARGLAARGVLAVRVTPLDRAKTASLLRATLRALHVHWPEREDDEAVMQRFPWLTRAPFLAAAHAAHAATPAACGARCRTRLVYAIADQLLCLDIVAASASELLLSRAHDAELVRAPAGADPELAPLTRPDAWLPASRTRTSLALLAFLVRRVLASRSPAAVLLS